MTMGRLLGLARLLKKASLAGAFFVPAIWLASVSAAPLCPAPGAVAYATVERVTDGDTLRLKDGRSVRMIGLNAPETGKKGRPAEPFAEAARKRLQTLVAQSDGRVGLLPGKQARDRYGRTLAHVFGADGSNLEARLLADGLGFQVAIAPNVALLDCQQAAERSARKARLGLWRQSPVLAPQQIRRSGFALVSGTVSQVRRNQGGLWIDLQGGLVLNIALRQLPTFDQKQLARLQGAQVEARGWVLDRSQRAGVKAGQARWMLPLTHPGMLKVIAR
ncbi:thermonuclease family protein [Pseudomonas sp. FSL R10-0056]|uniref:thermonuclease family protein n=2 Tax=Pseudomonas TaxID=286 RepID=UPI000BA2A42B|nr:MULTISPECIES: thermonuclease family protein [Pseudomonas]MCH4884940.1 thermonuclease family protein [Pseudomonas sp. TMW22080]MDN5404904.1 thermonuclease family protein [Pseudomonas sp.]MDN5447976.1 thermonuclease family protein [Pseudomonas sp.]MDN5451765.1 thermonuclease family protein [Pseudomonas sp.]MDN5459021.1 thermonuclease family protein [Pseudomonas sp.]